MIRNHYIEQLEVENLQKDLFIPFKDLTAIKNRILFILNGSRETIDPIDVPFLKKPEPFKKKPSLSVLISSQKDVSLCHETSSKIFFQIPNCSKTEYSEFIDLFLKNKKLMPWFPSVLIGENYTAALELLQKVQPKLMVTDNTGIACEAYEKKIPWIAGPHLNMVNSFSLLCVKENFNCHGAFVSNEISKKQIKNIKYPDNFKRYYRIYYPILLLTSRQCLFHQVIGCEKSSIDGECIHNCHKSTSIETLDQFPLFIEKSKGNYHHIYHHHDFLNTDIVTDLPHMFTRFFN